MQVILAESAGFCYGVKRAVELAQKTAEETQGCWMLGDLIHIPMWSMTWRPGASEKRTALKRWEQGTRW